MFFDFSNHAGAQVPIFTPKMKKMELAELARLARPSPRKWDFRRRSRPRELAQRSQDDVSLNKLPQISILCKPRFVTVVARASCEGFALSVMGDGSGWEDLSSSVE